MGIGSSPRGYHGKIPSRGDFVTRGLPQSFLAPWEDWAEAAMKASRALLEDGWRDAWMVAPVWRFSLAGGVCGPDGVLGLMLPSIDKVGRGFPLTIVALFPHLRGAPDRVMGAAFLDAAEDAARDAIAADLDPDSLAERIGAAPCPGGGGGSDDEPRAFLWTEGAPNVPATDLTLAGLPPMPDHAGFLAGGGAP